MFQKNIAEHQSVIQSVISQEDTFNAFTEVVVNALKKNKKIFFCGNGGSAADAQHLAAELTGRYRDERRPLPAIAVTTDTSALTCISNDYSFDQVFSRQIEALGNEDDVLIAISTSGMSPNVLKAVEAAKTNKMKTIGWAGKDGGKLAGEVDVCFTVQSNNTARIQEVHILIGHIMCETIDKELFQ